MSIQQTTLEKSSWERVENIEIGTRLGGGNFGEVFEGTWNGTTKVALKKLKSNEAFEEFAREATVLQSLHHPNIVRALGIHTTPMSEHYIVMEFLSKGSLDVVLSADKGSLRVNDLLSM